jgi:UDP-perosamine 4-acetyltransferase
MKKGILVIGAGGHAKVCIELLQAMEETVDFCIGNHESQDFCLSIPVIKGDENLFSLRQQGYEKVFIAIGANHLRKKLANTAIDLGFDLVNAISPQALISPSAQLGKGVAVMAGAIINAESQIQDLAIINTGASVDHDCQIGASVHVAPQCALAGEVQIGEASFLGIGTKVIPGICIGKNVMIAAGGVVISNIPDNVTARGIPAKIVENRKTQGFL